MYTVCVICVMLILTHLANGWEKRDWFCIVLHKNRRRGRQNQLPPHEKLAAGKGRLQQRQAARGSRPTLQC